MCTKMSMKRLTISILIALVHITFHAQERTHMPYSLYGLGDIVPKGFARNQAMGRTGIALSSPRYLNSLNPASYHLIDSLSFFFDFGFNANFVKYRTDIYKSQKGHDINISNLAIGFGLTRNWTASIGLNPYSSIGYKIQTTKTINGSPNEEFDVEINGTGGLNQFYWNNTYEFFDHLSLGVNLSYLFGSVESTETLAASELTGGDLFLNESSYMKRLFADFGLQAYFAPGKNWNITLGAVFGKTHNINITDQITIRNAADDVLDEEIISEGTFKFPMYAGAGISLIYNNSLTLAADYLYHDWSSTPSENFNYKYRSNNMFRFGAELVPGRISRLGYLGSVAYRAGAYYDESYLEIKGKLIPEYGITAGVGLPFLQNRTSINISYNYGIKGTLEDHLVKENYHSLMFSLTMHDWWFLKRKID